MYLARILVTVSILVPLTLAATTTTIGPTSGKPTTAGNSTTSGKLSQTTGNPSETKARTSKEAIALRLGDDSPATRKRGENITTRLDSDGNPLEQCQCTLFYLCNRPDVVTLTDGQQCINSEHICCRAPFSSLSTDEPTIPPPPVTTENPSPIDPANCICVPPAQCEDPLVSEAGAGVIEIRFKTFSCQSSDVCCPSGNITGGGNWYPPATVQPPSVDFTPNQQPSSSPPTNTSSGNECGMRRLSDSVEDRIIPASGDLAQTSFGEFPWMAMILSSEFAPDGVTSKFVCGASLLSASIVLTAAHCVAHLSPDRLSIRAGVYYYNTDREAVEPQMSPQDRPVSTILVHPEFNNRALFNDIALIRVSEDFRSAPHIAPICQPFADFSSYDPNNCLATGWGKNASKGGKLQTTLKKVDLALIEQSDCQKRLRTTKLGGKFKLNQSFICAGGKPGFDTCRGDGGGPLICPLVDNPNKYVQVGIVSWGIGCATNVPGVYASLHANQNWLIEQFNIMSVF